MGGGRLHGYYGCLLWTIQYSILQYIIECMVLLSAIAWQWQNGASCTSNVCYLFSNTVRFFGMCFSKPEGQHILCDSKENAVKNINHKSLAYIKRRMKEGNSWSLYPFHLHNKLKAEWILEIGKASKYVKTYHWMCFVSSPFILSISEWWDLRTISLLNGQQRCRGSERSLAPVSSHKWHPLCPLYYVCQQCTGWRVTRAGNEGKAACNLPKWCKDFHSWGN